MTKKVRENGKGVCVCVCVTEDMNMMRHHCLELGSAAHSRQNMYLFVFRSVRKKKNDKVNNGF